MYNITSDLIKFIEKNFDSLSDSAKKEFIKLKDNYLYAKEQFDENSDNFNFN